MNLYYSILRLGLHTEAGSVYCGKLFFFLKSGLSAFDVGNSSQKRTVYIFIRSRVLVSNSVKAEASCPRGTLGSSALARYLLYKL